MMYYYNCYYYLVYDREGAGSRLQEQPQGGGEGGGGPQGLYLPHMPPVMPLITLQKKQKEYIYAFQRS